jgi:hypothetical protein
LLQQLKELIVDQEAKEQLERAEGPVLRKRRRDPERPERVTRDRAT